MSIYENPHWPHFYWVQEKVNQALQPLLFQHGRTLGKMETLGFRLQEDETLLDATQNHAEPLTKEQLIQWHSTLFPAETGNKISVNSDIKQFLAWFNRPKSPIDLRIKAAVAHLWFATLQPFDDGNSRISQVISDRVLAQAENHPHRYYSMSTQIRKNYKAYEEILKSTQKDTLDITNWILWFLDTLHSAILESESKAKFWKHHLHKNLNKRQMAMLNNLFDGSESNITSSKWAKTMNCSQDTATRDINYLIHHNILIKSDSGGRSTSFLLKDFEINHTK
jgi:hypothetical protein